MSRQNVIITSAAVAVAFALAGPSAVGQSAKDLVGTWSLVSADAFGNNPRGSLVFDANSRFSAILMRTELPKYASNNRTQGTTAEYKMTVDGSLAFFGTYSVSGKDLILHIDGSTFPNWTGTDQKRTNISVSGDQFTYTQPAPSGGGGAAVVTWKRPK